jgi:RNA polymerase sigma-70 factor, ECF subfamily
MPPLNSIRKRDQTLHTTSDGMVLVITRDHEIADQEPADRHAPDGTADDGSADHDVSDHDLLLRMLAGDEQAFTALYRRRQGAVYRFALQMTGSVVIAEDVTQEVFMELIQHGRRFDPSRGALRSFLYGVARNLVLRRLDKDGRTELGSGLRSGTGSGMESPEPVMKDFPGVEDVLGDLTRRETIEQVRCAVFSLPAAYREAVVLCDLQDLSYGEAAQILDCPLGTVRSRLNRGRAMLAQKLRLLDLSINDPSINDPSIKHPSIKHPSIKHPSTIQETGSNRPDQEVPRRTAQARAGENVA